MTTVSGISSTVQQAVISQIQPATTATSAKQTSSSSGTTVTLSSATPAPLTYNASGQFNTSQISQLEQAINDNVTNTIATLFSGSSSDAASSTDSLLSTLPGLSNPSSGTATSS